MTSLILKQSWQDDAIFSGDEVGPDDPTTLYIDYTSRDLLIQEMLQDNTYADPDNADYTTQIIAYNAIRGGAQSHDAMIELSFDAVVSGTVSIGIYGTTKPTPLGEHDTDYFATLWNTSATSWPIDLYIGKAGLTYIHGRTGCITVQAVPNSSTYSDVFSVIGEVPVKSVKNQTLYVGYRDPSTNVESFAVGILQVQYALKVPASLSAGASSGRGHFIG